MNLAKTRTSRATGRTGKQRAVADFRTGTILEAARRVFARKGFEASLVDDIAAEAGIAKGTVYLYFKSKQDIYRAALQEDMAALAALKAQRVAEATGAEAKLRAYVRATIDYCEQRRDFFRIFLVESGKLTCPSMHSPKELRNLAAGQVAVLADLIHEAARTGEIHCPCPDFIAWTIGYAIRGMVERRLLNTAATDENEVEMIVEFLWNGLRPRAKSRVAARL